MRKIGKIFIVFILFMIPGGINIYPQVQGQVNTMNYSDGEIAYWQEKLCEAQNNLDQAIENYNYSASHGTGGAMALATVRNCQNQVEFCKEQLRNRGCQVY